MHFSDFKYPHLKKFSEFILENQLDSVTHQMIQKAKDLELPVLKLFSLLNDDQLFQASRKGVLNDIILPVIKNNPFQKVTENIENWKLNALVIPKEQINIFDIISIYNVRKLCFIDALRNYNYTKEEGISLQLEMENYFSSCIDMAFSAYEEIQKGALLESQEILNGIVSNLPVIVNKISKDGTFLKSFGLGLRALGLEDDELVEKSFFDLYSNCANANKALEGEKISFTGKVNSKTGDSRYFQNYFFPEKYGAFGFSLDVTEQKIIEEKLKENDYFIKQVTESSPIIIQVYDLIGSIELYANKGLPQILGYSSEQINAMGNSIAQTILHPEDFIKIYERNNAIDKANDGEIIESEMRVKHANGDWKWIHSRSTVFKRGEDGSPWQILSTAIDNTEKKLSEEKLQQQLRIFDTALSNTLDFNYIFDLNRRFIYINKPLLSLWKKTQEETIGKRIDKVISNKEFIELNDSKINQVLDSKLPVSWENFYINPSGKTGYYLNNFVPVFGTNGQIEAITGSTHDITDLKAAAEKQYRGIFESTNDAILIYNQNGYLVEVNPAGYKMHGYDYAEMIGMNGKDFVQPEDHSKFFNFIETVRDGRQYFSECNHIKKDNTILLIEKTGAAFTFKGEPHFLAVARDVTERKKTEEALKESEERFRAMADNIPNLAWIANADGGISWNNKRWFEYSGLLPVQLDGWGWQSIIDPNELPRVTESWTNSINTGKSWEMVFPIRGKDNIYRQFLTRVVPVKNKEGVIIKWFGTNTDITTQIESEANLEIKNRELIKINNDLDNFIYTASHDLKSPVSNLEGLINMFSDSSESLITEKGRTVLPMVGKSIFHLKTVIQELTEIARIQKDLDDDQESIDLSIFFNDILLSFGEDLKKYNGRIITNFLKGSVIRFSRKNLRSIISNLISNAIKYSSPDREGLISIETENQKDYFVLIVSDNGLGIPNEQKGKIFNMFKRFHTHVEGSGVGLYIVKRIIENSGGKIEVRSEEGKGSEFILYLKE